MNTSQFMDKQIMDLSNSQSNNDFLDLMNRPQEDHAGAGGSTKEEILPNYDFQPIRPHGTSPPHQPSNFDSSTVGGGTRVWNSADSKTNSGIRNYGSRDSVEPVKVISEKDRNVYDAALLSEIDRTMKKHADNLLHALEGVSARLSQLETRSRHLENSVDDLKVSVGNNYGSTDGKMRQIENILREVQAGVQVVRDKQEILEMQLSELQVSKVEQQSESQVASAPMQQVASTPMQSHHHLPPVALTQAPPTLPPPNAPPPPPLQNLPPSIQVPNQFPPTQIPPVSQRDPYFPPPGQTPEAPNQQYQLPPPQQLQPRPPAQPQPQLPPQYQPPPHPQYSQPPPPQNHPSQPQLQVGHPSEEPPYMPSQSYPPSIRQPSGAPPSQQFYGAPPMMYEPPPSSRPSSGFSAPYGPSSGHSEPFPYGVPQSQYGGGSPRKSQQISSHMGPSGGSGYPQLPTARILPQALPTASGVGGGSGSGSGSGGSGNRVPIDDVVDKVTNMGFSKEQVRATVRKLTENGQSVDLNVVLDKLMNDGVEGGPPRGWFGR